MTTPARSVVVRSGGLGDFILTLPLLRELARTSHVVLVTRPSYARLIHGDGLYADALHLDAVATDAWLAEIMRQPNWWRRIYSTLHDADPPRVIRLTSKPQAPPHAAVRLFLDAGLPVPSDLMQTAVLQRVATPDRSCLWLHPGSGSPAKNAPLHHFRDHAEVWRDAHPDGDLLISIGEADQHLLGPARQVFADLDPVIRLCPDLSALRAEMADRATAYIGNDTGVTHLAAAIGIPTTAIFVATDPAIWRPLGPHVTVECL